MISKISFVFILLLTLSGCKEDGFEVESGLEVSADSVAFNWPLTIASGRVDCLHVQEAVFISDGKTYPLNGMASGRSAQRGYLPLESIWKENMQIPGTKINIGPLISLALEQC